MIVPNKQYSVTVQFNETENRWKAKYESVKYPGISYDFPLPDVGPYNHSATCSIGRPHLDPIEELLFALVFSQMVSMTVASALARQKEAEEVEPLPHQSKTLPELARE